MYFTKIELEELKGIFKENNISYDDVREYFYQILTTSGYDYKIIANKNTQILLMIFKRIFDQFESERLENIKYEIKGKIINKNGLETFDLFDKTILIADSIIDKYEINNINSILKNLEKYKDDINDENLGIWTMNCENREDLKVDNLIPYFKHVVFQTTPDTLKFSNEIVQFINTANIGNEVNVNSYFLNHSISKITKKYIDSNVDCEYIENYNLNFRKSDIRSGVLFINLFDDLNVKAIIKLYEKDGVTTITPMVIMPCLFQEEIYDFCKKVSDKLNIKIPESIPSDNDKLYNWLNQTLSTNLIKRFFNDLGVTKIENYTLDNFWENGTFHNIKYNDLRKTDSFLHSNLNDYMLVRDFNKYNSVANYFFLSLTSDNYCELERMIELFKRVNLDNKEEYVEMINYKDNSLTDNQILANIINMADTQKINIDIFNNFYHKQFGVQKGSQLYRHVYENNSEVYKFFYELMCETFACTNGEIMEFAKELDKKYRTSKFTNFVKMIIYTNHENYRDSVFAINLTDVPESNKYDDERRVVKEYYTKKLLKDK